VEEPSEKGKYTDSSKISSMSMELIPLLGFGNGLALGSSIARWEFHGTGFYLSNENI
jgi:hypothetical protein